jgi:L,D-transpeptidase ErfK/SrfK
MCSRWEITEIGLLNAQDLAAWRSWAYQAVAAVVAFMLGCAVAQNHTLAADLSTRGEIIGTAGEYLIEEQDTLPDIARRFDLGFVELRAANPTIDVWLPAAGTRLKLPTAHILPDAKRIGLVVNLPEQRLYFFRRAPSTVLTFPLGTPKAGRSIPLGTTTVIRKRTQPTWTPPPSLRAERPYLPDHVPAGPSNPLGEFALDLGWRGFLIHGTNKPDGIGRRVTHGCIRLYPEDIKKLFAAVPLGAQVNVINQPIKLGWSDGMLYLEAHPTVEELDAIELLGVASRPNDSAACRQAKPLIRKKAGGMESRIDWDAACLALRERRGIPMRVLH